MYTKFKCSISSLCKKNKIKIISVMSGYCYASYVKLKIIKLNCLIYSTYGINMPMRKKKKCTIYVT